MPIEKWLSMVLNFTTSVEKDGRRGQTSEEH